VHLVVKRLRNKKGVEERRVARATESGGRHHVWLYSGSSQAQAGVGIVSTTASVLWQSVCLTDRFYVQALPRLLWLSPS